MRRSGGLLLAALVMQAAGSVAAREVLTFSANLGAVPLTAQLLRLSPASVPRSQRAIAIRSTCR